MRAHATAGAPEFGRERVQVIGPAHRLVVDEVVRLYGAPLLQGGHGRGGSVLQVDEVGEPAAD
jgi:hypothetical protein